jgi:UDP-2,3-diacylglucosamine hydrolase
VSAAPARVLLLSDLHLPPQPSGLRDVFVRFLEGPARTAQRVYILGDLFEYWVGDDNGLQIYAREIGRISALAAQGVEVYYMHGNRDFMVGKDFAAMSGATILPDPCVIDDLPCGPLLLSHGDIFCTDDEAYQRWRRFSRRPVAQWIYLHLPLFLRERIAGNLRGQSSKKTWQPKEIMDVNAAAVAQGFERHGIRRMIHGHTHRPAEHVDAAGLERIVLADWTPQRMEYLELDAAGMRRVVML